MLDKVLREVRKEAERAIKEFGLFNSPHEAYAVMLEEVDELWEEIKLKSKSYEVQGRINEEAIQVAATAIKLICSCCSALLVYNSDLSCFS